MPRPQLRGDGDVDYEQWVSEWFERHGSLLLQQQASLDKQAVAIDALAGKQDRVLDLLGQKFLCAETDAVGAQQDRISDFLAGQKYPHARTMSKPDIDPVILKTPLTSEIDIAPAASSQNRECVINGTDTVPFSPPEARGSSSTAGSKLPFGGKSFEAASKEVIDTMRYNVFHRSQDVHRDHSAIGKFKRILDSAYFDTIMGLVIFLNLCAMLSQIQLEGYLDGEKLGLSVPRLDAGMSIPARRHLFWTLDVVFNSLYTIELCVRFLVYGRALFRSTMQTCDALLVVALSFETFLLSGGAVPGLRLLRVLRITRVFKVIRFMTVFTELRVLLKTISWSVGSLGWSLLMLGFIIVAAGTVITQLVQDSLHGGTMGLDEEAWLWENFGTVSSSFYVLFEATFTGSWHRYSRYMIEAIHPLYAVFWIFYITVVNFAVMRVISALFLKQTMHAASAETLKLAMGKMVIRSTFAQELHDIFCQGDENGDGVISRSEFHVMMHDPQLQELIQSLDLDRLEMFTLFELVKADDAVDYEMLLQGCLTMKSSSPVLDTIQLLHGQTILKRHLLRMSKDVKDMKGALMGSASCRMSEDAGANIAYGK